MIEERSLENPAFARSAKQGILTVIASFVVLELLRYFGLSEWPFWSRMPVILTVLLVTYGLVAFLFGKAAKTPA